MNLIKNDVNVRFLVKKYVGFAIRCCYDHTCIILASYQKTIISTKILKLLLNGDVNKDVLLSMMLVTSGIIDTAANHKKTEKLRKNKNEKGFKK